MKAKQSTAKKNRSGHGSTAKQASRQNAQASRPQQGSSLKRPQSPMRKAFTVIICVVVALGLMLPVTGLGVASCSSSSPPAEQP
jgi:ABC-type Fe3+ transport system permease subunit